MGRHRQLCYLEYILHGQQEQENQHGRQRCLGEAEEADCIGQHRRQLGFGHG